MTKFEFRRSFTVATPERPVPSLISLRAPDPVLTWFDAVRRDRSLRLLLCGSGLLESSQEKLYFAETWQDPWPAPLMSETGGVFHLVSILHTGPPPGELAKVLLRSSADATPTQTLDWIRSELASDPKLQMIAVHVERSSWDEIVGILV